ncbi:hypothetical protein OROGR_027913 [Orobanche gracilis]
MARSSVPKFGNWESEEGDGVPYTAYFDKARKTRGVGGKMINPNDPQDPDMFPSNDPSPLAPPSNPPPQKSRNKMDEPIGTGPERRRRSKEDADFRQFSNSPARGDKMNESSYGGRAQRAARTARHRPEQGFDRSPLHPQHQANVTGRNNGSPAWEGKNHDSSHGTPGRTRMKPTARGDDSPDRGTAVPKFGDWDVTNSEDDNFTHIFNKVREERKTEAGNVSGPPKYPSYGARPQQAKEPKINLAVFAGRTRDDRSV